MARPGLKTVTWLPSLSSSWSWGISALAFLRFGWRTISLNSGIEKIETWVLGGANGAARAPSLMGRVPLGVWIAPLFSGFVQHGAFL